MKKSKTRNKLFITCMIFMLIFMMLFSMALLALTNTAFFEAYSEPEIKELQEVYDTYTQIKDYYEESVALFSSVDYIKEGVINLLAEADELSPEETKLRGEQIARNFAEYTSGMDIYLLDDRNIIRLYSEDGELTADVKEYEMSEGLEFVRSDDVFDFLGENQVYTEQSTYKSSHAIVKKLSSEENIFVIGIPRYDKIFDFCTSEIAIYSKYDQELLRLNTEGIEDRVTSNNISHGKNYKVYGIGENRRMVCYFSNEGEKGEYCLSVMRDINFGYRHIIYACLILLFAMVSVVFWLWSERVTKPLDFFMMWIKLIKEKGRVEDADRAETPMPKENYFLQNNIMIFFSFCIIPIILAGGVQWYAENQILNNYVEERYAQSAEFYAEILNERFYVLRSPLSLMSTDDRLRDYLEDNNERIDAEIENDCNKYMFDYFRVLPPYIEGLTIYNADGEVVASSVNEFESDRYIKYRINVGDDYKWSFADGLNKFILHYKIYGYEDTIVGYCMMELKDPDLNARTSYNNECLYSSYIYKYTDKIYNLASSPTLNDEEVANMIRSNEEYPLAKSITLEKAEINYFYVVKSQVFFDKIWNKYVISFMNAVFFLAIAMIFAAGILTRATLNPIIHLSNVLYNDSPSVPMSTLLLGKEEFTLIVNRVRTLDEQVTTYAREQKLLEAERMEHEKKRKDAEMLTLQTQINPHFMYNIFSSIAVLIKTGQTEMASKMVMYTGNLMRLGLYRGHVMISLKEEIEHVRQYINIQQIRYNNCMEVNINIDESLMQIKVVKFILQPVVENAIEHNVGYIDDRKLTIDIEAEERDDRLIITVIDNGKGMEDAAIAKLQKSINNFDMSNHLGLANINERIKLNCGNEYGVILGNNVKYGIRVEMILPVVVEKEE